MSRTSPCLARLGALLLAAVLTATACSGDTQPASDAPAPEGDSSAAPKPAKWPLTGEPAPGKLPDHRAVVVKIENTENSEPQVGLGSADIVVEELVEGGLTRLAAFYYSEMPAEVGPVRSLRGTDINLVKPARAALVASGGAPKTMKRAREAKVVTATEGTPGYYRVSDRSAPYNLFMNLKKLPKSKTDGPKPQSYLPWGEAAKLQGGKKATQITATFSAGSSTEWNWNGKVWHRAGSHATPADDFRTDNVLALKVKQTDAGYTDPAGNPVPESVLAGKGPATLFHQGKAYEGTWVKKSPTSAIKLVTAKGQQIPVPPGNTWIELVPASGGGGLTFGK
jgi:Protein of unknown function (DUF3048) N-terminal domain/Protein of unknown function (DUF3048) C-terminal domain